MKILLIQNMLYVPAHGGANKGNRELLEALAARGHSCLAIAPAQSPHGPRARADFLAELESRNIPITSSTEFADTFSINGVEIHAVANSQRIPDYVHGLAATRKFDCVLVGADDPTQTFLEAALAIAPGRVILLARATLYLPFGPSATAPSPDGSRAIAKTRAILCNSEYLAGYVRRFGPAGPEVASFPLPVMSLDPAWRVREATFAAGFITIINPCAIKGISIFLELAQKFPETSFAAVPTWGTTPEDRRALESLGNIRLLPAADDIHSILSKTRVLLVPSLLDEAFGRIVIEAMLQGIPVLASDVGGLPEAKLGVDYLLPVCPIDSFQIRFDENRLPVPNIPAQDIAPWENALREILANAERCQEISQASRAAAVKFVASANFSDVERFLQKIAQEPAPPIQVPSTPRQNPAGDLSPAERTALALKAFAAKKKKTAPALPPRPPGHRFPATSPQRRLFFLQQANPESAAYNIPQRLQFNAPIDIPALQKALDALVARHESLRTTFAPGPSAIEQVINEARPVELKIVASESELEIQSNRSFRLTSDLLLRAALLDRVLLLIVHHIAADALSMQELLRALHHFYEAFSQDRSPTLPPVAAQFADFAVQLNNQDDLPFWLAKLKGFDSPLQLPADHEPATLTESVARASLVLPPDLWRSLNDLARAEGVTNFMLFLAAWELLLHRHTGQDELIVGYPVDLRRPPFETAVGCFANTLISRSRLDPIPFRDQLARVKSEVLAGLAHRELPLEELIAANPAALFRVFFALAPTSLLSTPSFTAAQTSPPSAKFDLSLFIRVQEDQPNCIFEYRAGLFEPATIQNWLAHFQNLLREIARAPQTPLPDLDLLAADERQKLLIDWNFTAASYPNSKTVADLLAVQFQSAPHRIAVICGPRQLTYRELDQQSSALAHHLPSGKLIALCLDRSIQMIVALAAIFKAGAAYLPLDPSYPRERLQWMLENSGAEILLTQRSNLKLVPSFHGKTLCFDDLKPIPTPVRSNRSPEDLAYVIYTSGSTGQPKGVQIQQRALVNFLHSFQQTPGLAASDTWLAATSLSFDISGLEIWLPLITGARLILADTAEYRDPDALGKLIDRHHVTVFQSTPAMWSSLSQAGWSGGQNLKALCGGERMSRDLARSLQSRCGEVWNLYGPTETTIWSALHRVDARDAPVPIGRPIANTQIYLLDSRLQPVPIGVTGELYIGGDGLALGYLNDPELTARRFIPNPFQPASRLYKTGDLARYLPSGEIELLGRVDRQVKLRGFRIEPGEIEDLLRAHPDIAEVAVTARQDSLIAYFVPKIGAHPNGELREFLRAKVPEHMVPSYFLPLDRLPLTPNAKVDYKALPLPWAASAKPGATPLTDPFELQLAALWKDLLKIHSVTRDEDFFELGGHSLAALRLLARIKKSLGHEIALTAFLEHPTIAGLAAAAQSGPAVEKTLVLLRAGHDLPPLFLIHAHSGQPLRYMPLVQLLKTPRPIYGFQSRALAAGDEDTKIEPIAERYLREIKAIQPAGPYFFSGFCLGGLIAYEMTRQLRNAGEEVAFLGIIQAFTPAESRACFHRPFFPRLLLTLLTRLRYEYDNLFQIDRADSIRLQFDRLERLNQSLQVWLEARRGQPLNQQPRSEYAQRAYLNKTLLDAQRDFNPLPLPGGMTLFRAQTQAFGARRHASLGWTKLVTGPLSVQTVPGHQITLISQPNVQVLARLMDAALDRASQDAAYFSNSTLPLANS